MSQTDNSPHGPKHQMSPKSQLPMKQEQVEGAMGQQKRSGGPSTLVELPVVSPTTGALSVSPMLSSQLAREQQSRLKEREQRLWGSLYSTP